MTGAPRGPELTCKGWPQEDALRMLMNNLDPDVAERPQDLVAYAGTGKATRSWQAFDRIVRALRELEDDETLLARLRRARAGRPSPQRHGPERRAPRPDRDRADHLDAGSVGSPYRETEGMCDGSDAIADRPILNALANTAAGATG